MRKCIPISEIIRKIGNRNVIGQRDLFIDGFNLCNRETTFKKVVSYASSNAYVQVVEGNTAIICLFVKPDDSAAYSKILLGRGGVLFLSKNPELDFYTLFAHVVANTDLYEKYDYPSIIGERCRIHPTAVIENGVQIGNNIQIGPNSVLCSGSIIKDNVIIGCNSVIGAEGFQVVKPEGIPIYIPHVGRVLIDEGVNIGNCVSISRSLFEGHTYIGKNVKIDSLTSIAHNCVIEENSVITASVVICGSVKIKRSSWIAPNSSIRNKATIGENALVGIGSLVLKDVAENSIVWGVPAERHR